MTIDTILADYHKAQSWLLNQIKDPTGRTYLRDMTRDERLAEYRVRQANMDAFLAFAGRPERQFKSVQIAGTSGKGSVTVMIAALLAAAGQKTADHVSPYLQLPNEKLRLDGRMIAPSTYTEMMVRLRNLVTAWEAKGNHLLYGQAWTALTFLWMAHEQVDWGVVETGLGGRFSPATLLPVEASVVTNVDYDHLVSLGPELAQIAWHKAGVIRPKSTTVTAETKPNIVTILEQEAAEKGSRLLFVDHEVAANGLTVRTENGVYRGIRPNLQGRYQMLNAATAITTVDFLANKHRFELSDAAIQQALGHLSFPGRFEAMQQTPTVILDGAHNPHKMQNLVQTVQKQFPGRRVWVVMGLLSTKSAEGVLKALGPIAHHIVASQPNVYGKPPLPADALAKAIAVHLPDTPTTTMVSIADAVSLAIDSASGDDVVLVTGSIYLIGEARERWAPAREQLLALERSAA